MDGCLASILQNTYGRGQFYGVHPPLVAAAKPPDAATLPHGGAVCWHEWVGLQGLGWNVLSGGHSCPRTSRILRVAIQYRGNQRELLSPAARDDGPRMARTGAARLHLRVEGKSLHHAHEEAEREPQIH